jgi:putative ABC transport system permease protein
LDVCERIQNETGLLAKSQQDFVWMTINYYMKRTGIPINFATTVLLGFIIGAAVAGQSFYLFTLDNLRQFGTLKAMGVTNWRIIGMVLLQALVVALIGYGIGMGLAATAENLMAWKLKAIPAANYMAWQIPVGTLAAVILIMAGASLYSLRRVIKLEPASVFR